MYDINKKIEELANCTPARKKKKRRYLSLHEEVLSLVEKANSQVASERHVTPRSALIVMARALNELSSLDDESRRFGVLREVNKFITLQHNTFKAHDSSTKHGDLLPVGHPLSTLTASSHDKMTAYASWLAADLAISPDVKPLVAMAYSLPPLSLERKHAFIRLRALNNKALPTFFRLDPLVAAFRFGDGNSSAARRARVALQWRDRYGRWVEMGRGIDFNFRLPDGTISSAAGTFIGVDNSAGYSVSDGKEVANSGHVEVRNNKYLPDGIYSIKSPNATPAKARISQEALKRAKVESRPSTRKPTAEEMISEDIPTVAFLSENRVDAPSGWTKQGDGSFISDDNYKLIPNDKGYSLHRLDKDGNTGDKVSDVGSWAEAQDAAEKDSADYQKFKNSVNAEDKKVSADKTDSLIPKEVGESGSLPNGITYKAEKKKIRVNVFPGRFAEVDGVQVRLDGNTYDNKDRIKRLGYSWSPASKTWYKNYLPSDLLGTSNNTSNIKNQLDGIGGGDMPRYAGDNGSILTDVEGARNEMVMHLREEGAGDEDKKGKISKAFDVVVSASKNIDNSRKIDIPNNQDDRKRTRDDLTSFLDAVNASDFPGGPRVEKAKELAQKAIDAIDEKLAKEKVSPAPEKEKPSSGKNYTVSFALDRDMYETIGLDSNKDYSDEEIANAWLDRKGLTGKVSFVEAKPSNGFWPEYVFNIPQESQEDFADAYGYDSWDLLEPDITPSDGGPGGPGKPGGPGLPPSPPSRYTGPFSNSGDLGRDVTDSVVDGSESAFDLPKELEQMLDDDPADAGEALVEQMWDAANSRFDLQDQFNNNFSAATNSKDEFINSAVDALKKQLSDILESSFEERRDLEDDPTLRISFNKKKFMNAAEKKYRELLSDLWDGRDEGPDEPPTPPKGDGGVPPKAPSPSSPSTPELFKGFDVPSGAFQLRSVDYEPVGREDQESRNYTDDPNKLATRFPLQVLIRSLIEAMIGKKNDGIMSDIVDSNIGEDDELLGLEELNDIVDTPAPQAGGARGTGSGTLEFDAGDEFVPAEALYNAVFIAGGDPNRVIANAYDAVNGDRSNLDKLTQASGELPSAEEQKLVDDMMEEIGQVDSETPVSNKLKNSEQDQEPLAGELIYNVPTQWKNEEWFTLDPSPYVPTFMQPGKDGYTDNPEFLARDFATADLLQQFTKAITDGSGSAYFDFSDDQNKYDEGIFEVPVEAVRDALQLQGVNTNSIVEGIATSDENSSKEESKVEEPTRVSSPAQEIPPAPREPRPLNEKDFNSAINSFWEYNNAESAKNVEMLFIRPESGSFVFADNRGDMIMADEYGLHPVNHVGESWFNDPQLGIAAGWRTLNQDEEKTILTVPSDRQAREELPSETTPEQAPAPTPTYNYPGAMESGYSPNNTTKDATNVVIGKGARVIATKDNKAGVVVAVQNNPEYVRIRFDDGTVAVRSASKVKATSNADGTAPTPLVEEPQKAVENIAERLNVPTGKAPRLARSGETRGVNDESTLPDWLNGKTNENAVQSDFAVWGDRDAEIVKAARERISLESLQKEIADYFRAKIEVDNSPNDENKEKLKNLRNRIETIMGDIYGSREGISFGGDYYSIKTDNVSLYSYVAGGNNSANEDDLDNGNAVFKISTSFQVLDVSRRPIGTVRRTLSFRNNAGTGAEQNIEESFAYNEYVKLDKGKKKGFASAFNRYSENWYIANGIKHVKVFAAGGGQYQGGFVWALNGFDWDLSYRDMVGLRDLERQVRNRDDDAALEPIRKRINDAKNADGSYDMSKYPTPLEMALVGWYPGASDWMGKRVMVNESWHGVKTLNPTAREQIQAANYSQIKNAERRIESKQNIPNISSEFQAVVASDKFKSNSNILPHVEEIRDVLRNNRPLAVLSPAAKNGLNAYLSDQLLDENRDLPLDDFFRLREGLINEYRADHGYSDPFNSAEMLADYTERDFFEATKQYGTSDLEQRGFSVRKLSQVEGGVNSTFEVTHTASGQVFYVKNEEFASQFSDVPGGVTELEATTLLRAMGMQGIHDVRIGKNDKNLIIMSRSGATIPLAHEAINANAAERRGLANAQGRKVEISDPVETLSMMDNPEDIIRMSILDILGNNEDRHDGNWMMAFDQSTGKIRIFPVDNTVGVIEKRTLEQDGRTVFPFLDYEGIDQADVYTSYMPALIDRLGSDGMFKVYENEINKVIKNLDNPLYQPKGFELDAIISKWGSYDAFKDEIAGRLKKLITPGEHGYRALKEALDIRYWR